MARGERPATRGPGASPGDAPLVLDGVSKLFGKRHALRDVTVTLPADAVCGLVGANGAGKSTLLRCVIGLTEPSGGTGLVFGEKLGTDRAKRLVSYAPDELPMPDMLTGREYLDLIAGLEDRPPHLRRDAERLAAIFGVDGALTKLVGSYSHGMKRRLQFAGAFSSDAPLLILDEPFSGLDVEGSVLLRLALRTWTRSGRSALVTIHDLHTAERECDFIVVLSDGGVVAQGDPASIGEAAGTDTLEAAVLRLSGLENVSGTAEDVFAELLGEGS
ncbi:ABC transporter ATP-binding protein [Streptomyces sp. WAC08241]|uniref:ABC transporter ATP-binding protein n=1 Tax=Streptomyces sp. WAC08241 TaxID=2487421 RepID=UPI000F79F78C|nr:ABC transporter ATP-binding protein [Streptomyces sp. WAC08241]RSS31158.1 ABC transporter ATP-binding protein [Streptomyces sp. WAC08241]